MIKFTVRFKAKIRDSLSYAERAFEFECEVELREKYKDSQAVLESVTAIAWKKAINYYFSMFLPQYIKSIELKGLRRD